MGSGAAENELATARPKEASILLIPLLSTFFVETVLGACCYPLPLSGHTRSSATSIHSLRSCPHAEIASVARQSSSVLHFLASTAIEASMYIYIYTYIYIYMCVCVFIYIYFLCKGEQKACGWPGLRRRSCIWKEGGFEYMLATTFSLDAS